MDNSAIFPSSEWSDVAARPNIEITYEPRVGQRAGTADSQQLNDRTGLGVSVAERKLQLASADIKVPGVGLDLGFTRYYNSGWRGSYWGQFGAGGTSNLGLDVWLRTMSNGRVVYYPGSGSVFLFHKRSDGSFQRPMGLPAELSDLGSGRKVLTFRSGTKQIFDDGTLTETQDPHGKKITFAYNNQNGGLSSMTDTQGRVFTVTTNSQRYITQISDSTGRTWSYAYRAAPDDDQLASYTDPAGKTTTYTHDSDGHLTKITTPGGRVTRIAYNSGWRVTSVTRVTDVAAGTGPTTVYSDDASAGRACNDSSLAKTVVKDALWSASAPLEHTTTYCHDRKFQATKVFDGNGNMKESTYNPNGDATQLKGGGSGGSITNLNFDEAGTDPSYNLTGGDDAAGREFSYQYNAPGQPHRPSQHTNAQGKSTMLEYDGASSGGPGNLTRVYSGQSPTQVEAVLGYVAASDPDPRKRGLLKSAKDGKGNETTYAYNSLGQLTTVTPPSPLGQTTLTYDTLGRIKTVTDGKAQTRTYSYDKLDRTTKVDFSGGSTVEYTFDEDGNATSRPDTASGTTKTTSYEYDLLGRLKKETLPGLQVHNYTYDAASNLASFTDAGGTVSYRYDPANRLKDLAEPGGTCAGTPSLCTTFGYDGRDNPTSQNLPNGVAVTRTFDLGDQVTRITAKKGSDPAMVDLEYSYTSASQTGDLRNKVKDRRLNERTEYGYDFLDRLTRAETRTGADGAPGSGTLVSDYQYAYDKASNRTSQTVNTGTPVTTSYGFNAANQLCWHKTGAEPDSDCAPNPTGATTYTYDSNGNETAVSGGRSGSYNIRNQTTLSAGMMRAYAGPGQEELTGEDTTTLENDALGIGVRVKGTATHYYARTPGGGLISQKSGSTRHYYLQDALGSTVALTDSAGAVVQRYAYEPYGKLVGPSPAVSNRFRYAAGYATHATPSGTELYHFGARYYDPNLGRWTQTDPLDQAGDLRQANLYAYAAADPVNLIDPTGESPWDAFAKYTKERLKDILGQGGEEVEDATVDCARGFSGGLVGDALDDILRKQLKAPKFGPSGCIFDVLGIF